MTISPLDVQALLGFDPFAPEFHADPYACYRKLRAHGALRRTPGGLWLGLSFDVCARILRDPRFGHGGGDEPLPRRSRRPEWSGPDRPEPERSGPERSEPERSGPDRPEPERSGPERPEPGQPEWSGREQPEPERPEPGRPEPRRPERFRQPARSFLALDPPEHTRLRRLASGAFTARLVERLQGRVATLVDELLAGVHGEVDLIATLAHPLPVIVISEMLGVPPADQDRFSGWSDALARGLDPDFLLSDEQLDEREQARQEFAEYFRDLAARRRASPGRDLLSALATVEELSEADLLATCVLLLVAGHETTVNLIANGTLALLRHPDQLAYFRANPEKAPAVVEELLRYDPPVQLSARVALEDVPIAGQTIHRGEIVLMLLGAANRDPEVFSDPDRLDLTRAPERHLAFGLGIHFCLGAPLARLEGRLALGALVRRDLELPAAPLVYKDNLILRGLAELPVRLS